jgi:hypothetical protein
MFNSFVAITLIILSICVIYLIKNQKNNIENFSGNLNLIKEEINKQYNMDIESIRNLGAISKSLLTGKNYHNINPVYPGTLTIPGNMIVEGWSVSVPVGTIIMWSKEIPPPPNTTGFKLKGFILAANDVWAPCNGENGTPDLRDKFPIGQGNWNKALNSKIGGNVPLRNHIHSIVNDGNHTHSLSRHITGHGGHNHGNAGGSIMVSDRSVSEYNPQTGNSGGHSHGGKTGHAGDVSNQNVPTPYRYDKFNHETVPESIVVQYWIRVR